MKPLLTASRSELRHGIRASLRTGQASNHLISRGKSTSVASSTQTQGPEQLSKSAEPVECKPHAEAAKQPSKRPNTAELDEQLRQKMEGLAGDGGESGVEYEDGKPVAMKRSVKNNMFRYI